ncbi:MAG: hypothetical protein WDN72_03625 [Alphaproteobacteria bacterium]
MDWVLNSILAGLFVFLTRRTEWGFNFWEKVAGGFARLTLTPFYKDAEKLRQTVDATKNFLGIIVGGGTLLIPVIEKLENKKNKIAMIKWFDKKIYGKDEVANDPAFAEEYQAIADEPKKGFWTGMLARAAALTPMYLVMTKPALGARWLNEHYYPKVADGSKWLSRKVGIRPNQWLAEHGDIEGRIRRQDLSQPLGLHPPRHRLRFRDDHFLRHPARGFLQPVLPGQPQP